MNKWALVLSLYSCVNSALHFIIEAVALKSVIIYAILYSDHCKILKRHLQNREMQS